MKVLRETLNPLSVLLFYFRSVHEGTMERRKNGLRLPECKTPLGTSSVSLAEYFAHLIIQCRTTGSKARSPAASLEESRHIKARPEIAILNVIITNISNICFKSICDFQYDIIK